MVPVVSGILTWHLAARVRFGGKSQPGVTVTWLPWITRDVFHSNKNSALNFRKFPAADEIAFSGIFGKNDNLVRYTQFSRICYREFLFQWPLRSEFSQFSVEWLTLRKSIFGNFPVNFRTIRPHFQSSWILGWMENASFIGGLAEHLTPGKRNWLSWAHDIRFLWLKILLQYLH